jgi:hypothetical protein
MKSYYSFGPYGWIRTETTIEMPCWVCDGRGMLCDYHAERLSLDELEPEDDDSQWTG